MTNSSYISPELPPITTIFKSKFFYLLCSLILYFISTALLYGNAVTNFINSFIFSLVIYFCIFPVFHSKRLKLVSFILALVLLATHWTILFVARSEVVYLMFYATCTIFLITVTYSVLYDIYTHKYITKDTLLGAVCGYLLIGFTWSVIYMLIATINPQAFSGNMLNASLHETSQHFFYYSFTSLTTLGYGDVLPVSNIARTCAWFESVTGQIYLAVWISQLVGLRIAQEMRRVALGRSVDKVGD